MEEDVILIYKYIICIPNVECLRRIVMDELHKMPYSYYPRYHKTIATTKKQYFWPWMKRNISKYISKCIQCQQVKDKHQHLSRFVSPLAILEWK